MADVKISQLPAASSMALGDEAPIVQSAATKRATKSMILGADLAAIHALTSAANKIPYATGPGAWALADFLAAAASWTPAITFATPGDLSVGYAHQIGRYFRIGPLVIAWFSLQTSSFTHTTASGALRVGTLPVAPSNISGMLWPGMCGGWSGITKANYTSMSFSNDSGATFVTVLASGSAQNVSTITAAETTSGGGVTLRGLFAYGVA